MAFVAPLAIALSLGSAAVGAYGAYQTGQAEKASALYNSKAALQNAQMAKTNAGLASEAGATQANMSEQRTRATVGAIKANEAASGVDVNTGSSVDVRSSAAELGELDALTVRSNATKEAYGYQTQAHNFETQSGLDKFEAANDATAGMINASSTFLGGAGNAANEYAIYQIKSGGMTG